jgi:hypothetical protein
MVDILVKLHELEVSSTEIAGVEIRRPMPQQKGIFKQWVAKHFGEAWCEELECSFKALPVTAFVALIDDKVVGFACYDVTFRGFLPGDVSEKAITGSTLDIHQKTGS